MNTHNPFIPVLLASGIAVVGCAAAFYFSDTGTKTSKKKFIINTNDFDDEMENDDLSSKHTRKNKNKNNNITYDKDYEDSIEDDDSVDDQEDDDDEPDEDDGEEDDDDEEDDEEYVEDEDYDDDDGFLIPGKKYKKKAVLPSRKGKKK